jgi:hypothetical protein
MDRRSLSKCPEKGELHTLNQRVRGFDPYLICFGDPGAIAVLTNAPLAAIHRSSGTDIARCVDFIAACGVPKIGSTAMDVDELRVVWRL